MTATSTPEALRVVRLRSIHEVDAALWDSINSDRDIFHTHRFIRCVEDSGVEDAEYWHLLFYRGEELAATAVLSAFVVSLDLFVGGGLGQFIRNLRRWWPGFLKIRILFCGLPISLGQHNLVARRGEPPGGVAAALVREMSAIAEAQGIDYLCVKEFLESQVGRLAGMEAHGFFRAHSIPYVSLNIRWPSFAAYLASLRHGYRRPIKLALKKMGRAAPRIEAAPAAANGAEPRLLLGGGELCPPGRLFELYMQVMERAEVKLETLNLAFFERLYAELQGDLEVLAFVAGGENLGSALLLSSGGAMTFMLVGLDYARRDEYDVYFNLVYGILSLAIARGCRQLDLGQTSYWLKQRIGGAVIPEYFYFKSRRPLLHLCIRSLRSVIFPELKVPRPRAFRAAGSPG